VAISGCPNSCAQPQLADFGIIAGKKVKNAEGEREPRYDLYRREAEGLGQKIAEQLTQAELLEALERLI
jgi:sulfite reductase beta subunit-like hemoprotein